ncbi:MAG: outer membrane beta-barrel protein [Cyclobacteriaceae bacterium]|nr:outer membrane beta-barrel protein [Cyclobacteriaceae bacterium]
MKKRMQNQSNQELDNLFKRAAEKSEDDTAMPDWTDMNSRLNEAERAGAFWRTGNVITGSVLVLTVAVLVWWGIDTTDTHQDKARAEVLNENSIDKNNTVTAPEEINKNKSTEPTISIATLQPDSDEGITSDKNEFITTPVSLAKPQSVLQTGTISSKAEREKESIDQFYRNNDDISLPVEREKRAGNEVFEKKTITTNDNQHVLQQEVIPIVKSDNEPVMSVLDSVRVERESIAEDVGKDGQVNSDDKEQQKSYPGFSVKLAVSPDYSTVKSIQPDRIGVNYGFLIEYGINKNLSVATGLIRSNKFYSARDIEYYGQVSDRVDGDCRMWDIPVMLYYNFSPERTWSLYAGLGVSSYLMSREKYVYYVEGGYGNTYTYYQTINGKNNGWFSMLNLSVGLSKQLNTRWAIQLEPFYKAPLAGVGEGDVSLASFGAFFNVKHTFLKNK